MCKECRVLRGNAVERCLSVKRGKSAIMLVGIAGLLIRLDPLVMFLWVVMRMIGTSDSVFIERARCFENAF